MIPVDRTELSNSKSVIAMAPTSSPVERGHFGQRLCANEMFRPIPT
jgi:hypothetical protein